MNDASQPPIRRRFWLRWFVAAVLLNALSVYGYRWFAEQTRLVRLREEYAAAVKLRERFECPVSFPPHEQRPLRELFGEFEQQTGIGVAWADEGYLMQRWLDLPLGCQLPALPAHEWLETVCRLRDFTWQVTTEGVAILNGDLPSEPRYWQNYPLPVTPMFEADDIYNLVSMCVDPDEWEDVGGNRAVELTPGGLTTFQPLRGHLRTARFLAELSSACRMSEARFASQAGTATATEPIWLEGDSANFRALQEALERPITLRVVDMPPGEFVDKLSELAKFPIIFHPREHLVTVDRPEAGPKFLVNCQLQGTPLRDVLKVWKNVWGPEMPYRFGLAARGQLLVICDPNDQDQQRTAPSETLCAYPVADLTSRTEHGQFDELTEVIRQALVPDTWRDVGGVAVIESVPSSQLLLISQSPAVHRQIQELLTKLRQARCGALRQAALTPDPPLPELSAEVKQRLAKPLKIEFKGEPDSDAWRRVFQQGEIRVPGTISNESSPTHHLWCHLPARPLRENLQMLFAATEVELRHLEQVTEPHDTSRYEDADLAVCEIFELRPWLLTRNTSLNVVDLITAVVDPDDWGPVGGHGSCTQFQDSLIVRVHPRTMARVRRHLQALEEYTASGRKQWRGQALAGDVLNQPLDLFGPTDQEAVRRKWFAERSVEVRKLLQQRVTAKIHEKPRAAALYDLAVKYDLPLVVRAELFGQNTQAIVPCTSEEVLKITSHDLVTVVVEDQPLGEVLQQLIGDPAQQQIVVTEGIVQIGRTGDNTDPAANHFLYCVDDLILPRGPLRPKQLIRTLEEVILQARRQQGNMDPNLFFSFHFGNLLELYNDFDPRSRQRVEQTLRELRSGERKPVPAVPGDSNFFQPNYPPDFFRPFIGSSVIPVVG